MTTTTRPKGGPRDTTCPTGATWAYEDLTLVGDNVSNGLGEYCSLNDPRRRTRPAPAHSLGYATLKRTF